jgi:hypothetical protein
MLNNIVSLIDQIAMNHQNHTQTNSLRGHVRYIKLIKVQKAKILLHTALPSKQLLLNFSILLKKFQTSKLNFSTRDLNMILSVSPKASERTCLFALYKPESGGGARQSKNIWPGQLMLSIIRCWLQYHSDVKSRGAR